MHHAERDITEATLNGDQKCKTELHFLDDDDGLSFMKRTSRKNDSGTEDVEDVIPFAKIMISYDVFGNTLSLGVRYCTVGTTRFWQGCEEAAAEQGQFTE